MYYYILMIYIPGTLDFISLSQKGCFVGGTGGHGTATADELVSLPPASQGWHTLKEEVGGFQRRS